ncbi:hypothetical protein PanWU01x14_350140 [Parasponia andersonii]|uniref:Uncharacterized protein n=1 Tax=Parasponia andersonii TaxID=3476 RepID=A0A2P5AB20_PARAD|nr:hypothetical protein PanWU01x14_350140 [Parasponia andersonii]
MSAQNICRNLLFLKEDYLEVILVQHLPRILKLGHRNLRVFLRLFHLYNLISTSTTPRVILKISRLLRLQGVKEGMDVVAVVWDLAAVILDKEEAIKEKEKSLAKLIQFLKLTVPMKTLAEVLLMIWFLFHILGHVFCLILVHLIHSYLCYLFNFWG